MTPPLQIKLAFAVPASIALAAAFFVHHGGFTAFGAQVTDLHFGTGMFHGVGVVSASVAIAIAAFDLFDHNAFAVTQVMIKDLPNAIWQRFDAVRTKAQGASAADADQLLLVSHNVSAMTLMGITIAEPGQLSSMLSVRRVEPGLFNYYSLSSITLASLAAAMIPDAAHLNRAVGSFRFLAGIPGDLEPPAVPE